MKHPLTLLIVAVATAVLAACAAGPENTSTGATPATGGTGTAANAGAAPAANVLAPNANLLAQGIPPVPQTLVSEVAKYTDFRGHTLVDWHPTKREMLIAHRKQGANTSQLFRLATPMGEPEQLTDFADPVTRGKFEPVDGRYLVFQRSNGGNEAHQLYRLDLADRQVTPLTDGSERNEMQQWMHGKVNGSSRLLYTSLPLDRTAEGGKREKIVQTLTMVDPANPTDRRKLAELPGGGWDVGAVSWDNKTLALNKYNSATDTEVWLLTLANGKLTQLLPAPGSKTRSVHAASGFSKDNRALYVATDSTGEFNQLVRFDLRSRRNAPITRHIPWDTLDLDQSADGKLLAVQANVEGRVELRFFDARTLKEAKAPALPAGSVYASEFHPSLPDLAFTVTGSQGPGQIWTANPATGTVEQWTRAYAPPGVDTSSFSEQRIVRWKSFDGREISGLLNMPPARFTGRVPVLITIHGGPEGQAKFGFLNRYNYFINELGIAVIQPNVRGSSGFGKTFLGLDNGVKREDSVKDIGALLDWIATQPNLDPNRVLVTGGSYGGYMTLAVATNYPERIAGAIDIVGISNFVTFLNNTESYRRDLRRVEYGDERDPAMRAHLEKISPLTNASRITKPLFVVQGKNDPRVPYTEAEQIVAKARENKTPVWYLRAENEGHGFARKENADFQFYATILFMRETLLK